MQNKKFSTAFPVGCSVTQNVCFVQLLFFQHSEFSRITIDFLCASKFVLPLSIDCLNVFVFLDSWVPWIIKVAQQPEIFRLRLKCVRQLNVLLTLNCFYRQVTACNALKELVKDSAPFEGNRKTFQKKLLP